MKILRKPLSFGRIEEKDGCSKRELGFSNNEHACDRSRFDHGDPPWYAKERLVTRIWSANCECRVSRLHQRHAVSRQRRPRVDYRRISHLCRPPKRRTIAIHGVFRVAASFASDVQLWGLFLCFDLIGRSMLRRRECEYHLERRGESNDCRQSCDLLPIRG